MENIQYIIRIKTGVLNFITIKYSLRWSSKSVFFSLLHIIEEQE